MLRPIWYSRRPYHMFHSKPVFGHFRTMIFSVRRALASRSWPTPETFMPASAFECPKNSQKPWVVWLHWCRGCSKPWLETQDYCPIVRWTLGSLIHVKEPFFEQMRNWQAQLWCKLHASAWAAWFPLSTRYFDVRKLPKDGLFFSCSALATCTKSIHFAVASEDVCLKTIGCLRGEWPPEGCKGVPTGQSHDQQSRHVSCPPMVTT